MDTSEEYIKMCDCEEIQKVFSKYKYTRKFIKYNKKPKEWIFIDNYGRWLIDRPEKTIYLPTQDQIQEMLGEDWLKAYFAFDDFLFDEMMEENGIGSVPKKNPKFTSMEQLWLAFFMHEKHGKIWLEGKWVKK